MQASSDLPEFSITDNQTNNLLAQDDVHNFHNSTNTRRNLSVGDWDPGHLNYRDWCDCGTAGNLHIRPKNARHLYRILSASDRLQYVTWCQDVKEVEWRCDGMDDWESAHYGSGQKVWPIIFTHEDKVAAHGMCTPWQCHWTTCSGWICLKCSNNDSGRIRFYSDLTTVSESEIERRTRDIFCPRDNYETGVMSGGHGGSCTCPNGHVYYVADNYDNCGSLACIGGDSGTCNNYDGPWSYNKVTCDTSRRRRLDDSIEPIHLLGEKSAESQAGEESREESSEESREESRGKEEAEEKINKLIQDQDTILSKFKTDMHIDQLFDRDGINRLDAEFATEHMSSAGTFSLKWAKYRFDGGETEKEKQLICKMIDQWKNVDLQQELDKMEEDTSISANLQAYMEIYMGRFLRDQKSSQKFGDSEEYDDSNDGLGIPPQCVGLKHIIECAFATSFQESLDDIISSCSKVRRT